MVPGSFLRRVGIYDRLQLARSPPHSPRPVRLSSATLWISRPARTLTGEPPIVPCIQTTGRRSRPHYQQQPNSGFLAPRLSLRGCRCVNLPQPTARDRTPSRGSSKRLACGILRASGRPSLRWRMRLENRCPHRYI